MEETSLTMDARTIDELNELASTVGMLRGYLNDQMIKDLGQTMAMLSKLANAIVGTDIVEILEKAMQDPELDRVLLNPPRVGLVGMIRALADDDAKRGLGILVQLLRSMGRAARVDSKSE
jgi:uncharacterized protein YjgD (DUF1641 family)